jgi:NAD(P)-dependent dehydrogenase (short-subunit alcohol dehydrogenase family)
VLSQAVEPKVVIVTGASHGIGAGLVAAFLNAGYKVLANSRAIEESFDGRQTAGHW